MNRTHLVSDQSCCDIQKRFCFHTQCYMPWCSHTLLSHTTNPGSKSNRLLPFTNIYVVYMFQSFDLNVKFQHFECFLLFYVIDISPMRGTFGWPRREYVFHKYSSGKHKESLQNYNFFWFYRYYRYLSHINIFVTVLFYKLLTTYRACICRTCELVKITQM